MRVEEVGGRGREKGLFCYSTSNGDAGIMRRKKVLRQQDKQKESLERGIWLVRVVSPHFRDWNISSSTEAEQSGCAVCFV